MWLVLSLAATAAVLMVALPSVLAEDVTWGDTTVTGTEAHTDLSLTLDGNLTVAEGGRLTITDSEIVVNATDAEQYWIQVEHGGHMVLENVTLSSGDGTYRFEVQGRLEANDTLFSGLPHAMDGPWDESGLTVRHMGEVVLRGCDVLNEDGLPLFATTNGSAEVHGGLLRGRSTAVRANEYASVELFDVELVAIDGLHVILATAGAVSATSCTISSEAGLGSSRCDAASAEGSGSTITLEGCTVLTPELATVTRGGRVEVTGGSFLPLAGRAEPDLLVAKGVARLHDVDVDDVNVSSGTLWLLDAVYRKGVVYNGSRVHSVGIMPPLVTISLDSVLFQYYWVDFRLLDPEGIPKEGMDLNVLDSERQVVVETASGPDGWVRDVPIRSWRLDGDILTYEPSHRVEFAGPAYQITNLQVFENTTVVLWDMLGSYDLVLDSDTIKPSVSAPRANRTFDLIVDGDTLVPYPYSSGTTRLDLYVDGEFHERVTHAIDSRDDVRFKDLNLTVGEHFFHVIVDPTGQVDEMNEVGNNELVFLLDVAPGSSGPGELVDLYVEITRTSDSVDNEGETLAPGVIYIDYTVRAQNAMVWPRNVPLAVYVDGDRDTTVRVDLLTQDGTEYVHSDRFTLNLPRGEYTITVVVDPDNEIDEEFENNNEDQTDIVLDPDVDDGLGFNSTCCMALVILGMIVAVFALSAWSNRQQQKAAEMGMDGMQYGAQQGTTGPGVGVLYTSDALRQSRPGEAASGVPYEVSDLNVTSADRLLAPDRRTTPTRERFEAPDLTCPRCQGHDIIGFADGSAKCQSCRKIFFPGRRQ